MSAASRPAHATSSLSKGSLCKLQSRLGQVEVFKVHRCWDVPCDVYICRLDCRRGFHTGAAADRFPKAVRMHGHQAHRQPHVIIIDHSYIKQKNKNYMCYFCFLERETGPSCNHADAQASSTASINEQSHSKTLGQQAVPGSS